MAKIPLSKGGFEIIPEGEYIFKITKVDFDQAFGEIKIYLESDGGSHIQKFNLLDKTGNPNQKVYNFFSFFAKVALNDFDREEIDHTDLVGGKLKAKVVHNKVESTTTPNKTLTFVNLSDIAVVEGEEKEDEAPVDMSKLFGNLK